MFKPLAAIAATILFITACGGTDSPVNPDPTPDVSEKDSVVISQERYERLIYSDTINVSIVKENGAGSTKVSVYDFGFVDHRSAVSFSSESFTKGEVKVIVYGKRPTLFDPEPQLGSYMFSTSKTSVTDTLTGVISSIAVVSGAGTTCRMKGQIIFLP